PQGLAVMRCMELFQAEQILRRATRFVGPKHGSKLRRGPSWDIGRAAYCAAYRVDAKDAYWAGLATRPCRTAHAATCARDCRPSLSKMLRTCACTGCVPGGASMEGAWRTASASSMACSSESLPPDSHAAAKGASARPARPA